MVNAFRYGCVILFLCTIPSYVSHSQYPSTEEYQVKAVFLYNFSRFVEWPESSYAGSNAPFVIGILGGNPFGNYLDETIKGEAIGSHIMTVHHFRDINDIDNCQILFINYKDPEMIKKTVDALAGRNILTVNEYSNFVRQGGMIQFYTEMSKIKLMINTASVKNTQLQISSKLMRVAKIY
jgi:hypothetical protein